MTNRDRAETLPQILFCDAIEYFGGVVVMRGILELTKVAIANGETGITLGDETSPYHLSTSELGVSVRCVEMQPYLLTKNEVALLMRPLEQSTEPRDS